MRVKRKSLQIMELEQRRRQNLYLQAAAPENELIRRADLVTEMKEVKHYYDSGVTARMGIEY